MTGQRTSIAIVITSIPLIAYLCIGIDFRHMAVGQAEETFGQNATFLKEVEQMQRQKETQTATPASQNQTRTESTHIPKNLLQQQIEESPTLMGDLPEPNARMVLSGENAYVVWGTNITGDWEIMFRGSTDNGKMFGQMINLSNSPDKDSENAEITASGTKVFVIWQENGPANGISNSVLRVSNDNGKTFGPIMELFGNSTIGERQSFSTYENTSYGIQMKYPSDWQVTMDEENNDSVIAIVGFYSPFEYRLDKYGERLWISLENLRSENITLEDYSNEIIRYKNETLSDFELLDHDTNNTILAGFPAYRLVYTSTMEDSTLIKQMEIGTKISNKVYYLDYYAEDEKYDEFLPVIQDMINSFEIGDIK